MSPHPTRATIAGRVYLDLQNLARRQGRPTDELHQLYALEGFLTRLVVSPYADTFVLKGGVLLAAYDIRRPTRDVDLQGQHLPNDIDHVLAVVREIVDIHLDDGLEFDAHTATADSIRDEDAYSGVRVTITGQLAAARLTLHVDVNVGDPIWPPPQHVVLPRLLEGAITIAGYPLVMICAEKIVTAVQRGQANTRWRDFVDVYTLAQRHDIDGHDLSAAVTRVATHRQATLAPLRALLDGYAAGAQRRWVAWRRKQRLDQRLPEDFAVVLRTVLAFADPVLTGVADDQTWLAAQARWAGPDPR